MPWIKESVMSQRQRMIEQLLLPGAQLAKVCKTFGISRKTAYKWLSRYQEGGIETLSDMSRTPHQQPNKISAELEALIINAHKEYPYWGPRKLRHYLLNIEGFKDVPAHTTFARVLKRHNCEVITSNKSKPAKIRFERSQPNELWQMDFKGSFMTANHRCHPLTVIDDYSRYSIGLQACENETHDTVKSRLTAIFKEFGMPEQINVDNGNPWGSSDLQSVTSLMVWLTKLGIKLSHSAPYHPQTNGKDERFHRTLKLEVLHQRSYKNCRHVQAAFNGWQHTYNFKRPHESIGGKAPGSRYCVSSRKFPDKLPEAEYDSHTILRKVHNVTGTFCFKGHRYRAGKGFCKEWIAIKETDQPDEFVVYFMDRFIKRFKLRETV